MLTLAFEEHSYLLELKGILNGNNYVLFKKIIKGNKLERDELVKSLSVLIKALRNHYNRNVVVLLDEYDRYLMDLDTKILQCINTLLL